MVAERKINKNSIRKCIVLLLLDVYCKKRGKEKEEQPSGAGEAELCAAEAHASYDLFGNRWGGT